MITADLNRRRAGVLLHPTSLPSGVLDAQAESWLQLLADSGFSIWQVLPLGEPQLDLSPYQCSSAFAFNPALLPGFGETDLSDPDFIAFCAQQQFWLDDYVLYTILKQQFDGASWTEWPRAWKYRAPEALQQTAREHETAITTLRWQQYRLHRRWQQIRARAAELGILLFGDMPIFVSHDSADVWAHPEQFLLDADGYMQVVSGVPPDYFSETGQRWGNPHYNWEQMQQDDYAWWKARVRHHLEQFDLVRIDHFRGLVAAWTIDAACDTAIDGYWQPIPGDALLASIRAMLDRGEQQLPFVAEDLGVITPEVTALRKKYGLPGIAVLQFGFDEFDDNPHKLKNITEDRVVYTGTHDNDTTKGWFDSLEEHVKNQVLQVLDLPQDNGPDTAARVVDRMLERALFSPARMAIFPAQDLLHLGTGARMNIPGIPEGNWRWRLQPAQFEQLDDGAYKQHLHAQIMAAGRLPGTD